MTATFTSQNTTLEKNHDGFGQRKLEVRFSVQTPGDLRDIAAALLAIGYGDQWTDLRELADGWENRNDA